MPKTEAAAFRPRRKLTKPETVWSRDQAHFWEVGRRVLAELPAKKIQAAKGAVVNEVMANLDLAPKFPIGVYARCPNIVKDVAEKPKSYSCDVSNLCPYCRVRKRLAPLSARLDLELSYEKKAGRPLKWWSFLRVHEICALDVEAVTDDVVFDAAALYYGFREVTRQAVKTKKTACRDVFEIAPNNDRLAIFYTVFGVGAPLWEGQSYKPAAWAEFYDQFGGLFRGTLPHPAVFHLTARLTPHRLRSTQAYGDAHGRQPLSDAPTLWPPSADEEYRKYLAATTSKETPKKETVSDGEEKKPEAVLGGKPPRPRRRKRTVR
jgi:hypothetical protein